MSKAESVRSVGNTPWVCKPWWGVLSHRVRGLLLLVVALSSLCTSPAFAEESDKTRAARQHYKNGEDAFKVGNYPEALKEFEAGFALVNRPGFLLNMAHAYRRMNELKRARALYKSYLLANPDSEDRNEVQSVLKEIDSALEAEETSQSDARKAQDKTLLPKEPTPSSASRPGTTLTTSTAVTPDEDNGHFYGRWWFWTLVGAAVVGGVTAVVVMTNRPHYDANGTLGTLGHP